MRKTTEVTVQANRKTIALPSAACLRRDRTLSTFCVLVAEQPDRAAADLPAYLREALPIAIADEINRCAPLEPEQMIAELTQTLSLHTNTSQEDRKTWLLAASVELESIPADLAREALAEARRACRFTGDVIPFVFNYVADYPARRRKRLANLQLLARVAGVNLGA